MLEKMSFRYKGQQQAAVTPLIKILKKRFAIQMKVW